MPVSIEDRYLEIDIARTAAIVMMVIYHAAFDLSTFFDVNLDPLSGRWFILERITANLFLFLVGVSFAVSAGRRQARGETWAMIFRKSFRKSLLLFGAAMIISAVTFLMVGPLYVRFGILHLIAASTLLLPLLLPLREWNALLAIPIFLLGKFVQTKTVATSLLLPLGLVPAEFVSVDYFPLFPWMSAILAGVAVGNFAYNRGRERPRLAVEHWHMKDSRIARALGWPGRHSLLLYMVHQPIVYGILWLVFKAAH